jgi:hypothetical protein
VTACQAKQYDSEVLATTLVVETSCRQHHVSSNVSLHFDDGNIVL